MRSKWEKAKVGEIQTFKDLEGKRYRAHYRGNSLWDLRVYKDKYNTTFLASIVCTAYANPRDIMGNYHLYCITN